MVPCEKNISQRIRKIGAIFYNMKHKWHSTDHMTKNSADHMTNYSTDHMTKNTKQGTTKLAVRM